MIRFNIQIWGASRTVLIRCRIKLYLLLQKGDYQLWAFHHELISSTMPYYNGPLCFQCWRLFQKLLPKSGDSGVHWQRVLGPTNQVPVHVSSQRHVLPLRRPELPLQAELLDVRWLQGDPWPWSLVSRKIRRREELEKIWTQSKILSMQNLLINNSRQRKWCIEDPLHSCHCLF